MKDFDNFLLECTTRNDNKKTLYSCVYALFLDYYLQNKYESWLANKIFEDTHICYCLLRKGYGLSRKYIRGLGIKPELIGLATKAAEFRMDIVLTDNRLDQLRRELKHDLYIERISVNKTDKTDR